MRVLAILVLAVVGLSGCVSSNRIQTIQVGDTNKSCEVLSAELSQLGVQFQDAKDDSGITGKNVGMAILFWPGIIVNEINADGNQSSVQQRIQYLTGLYNEKCLSSES